MGVVNYLGHGMVKVNEIKLESGDKSENRLPWVREAGEEVRGRDEGSDAGGAGPQAAQTDGDRVRGPGQGFDTCQASTGKKADFWPYVPYDVVPHPYAPGTYNKKAPAGYVRDAVGNPEASSLARASSTEVKYTTAFNDDNPNACAIM